MHLLQRTLLAPFAAAEPARFHFRRGNRRKPAEHRLHGPAYPVVIDRPGGGHDHLRRAIALGHEARQIVA